jgi:hypothetical protein
MPANVLAGDRLDAFNDRQLGRDAGPAALVLDLEQGKQRGGLDDLRLALAAGGPTVRVIFEELVIALHRRDEMRASGVRQLAGHR